MALLKARDLPPGMTMEFVTTFGEWCDLYERRSRVPR
jgi:hypothetical protein